MYVRREIFVEGQGGEPSSFGVQGGTKTLKGSAKSGGGQLTLLAPPLLKVGRPWPPRPPPVPTPMAEVRDRKSEIKGSKRSQSKRKYTQNKRLSSKSLTLLNLFFLGFSRIESWNPIQDRIPGLNSLQDNIWSSSRHITVPLH